MVSSVPASPPVPFGALMPDLADFDNPGALVVQNCIPYGDQYKPFSTLSEISASLGSKCFGAFAYRDSGGNVTIFAGTATGLYKFDAGAWVDVTRQTMSADVPYTTAIDGFWDFLNYGTLVIATNYNDDIQCFDIAADALFSQMSATAPKCRRLAIVKNFLVCVDVVDSDGSTGYRLRWGPLGDPKGDWTDAPTTTQADFEDIPGGDYSNSYVAPIQDYGFIVQGRELWRMDYVGGADIWDFTPLDKGRGSILPRGCISNGSSVFFPGEDGFYEYDGQQLVNIGNEKINKYFYSIFNQQFDYNLNAGVDPINSIIYWAFPSMASVDGSCDMLLAFNWLSRRFTFIQQNTECLFNYISTGVNMDDAGFNAQYPSVDGLPYSLDSRFWTGGKTGLAAFDSTHALGLFTGALLTATIITAETRLNNSGRAKVDSVIPYIDGGATILVSLGYRAVQGDAISYTDAVAQNPYTGEFDFDLDSVFFRAQITISGSWTFARGISFRSAPAAGA